MRVVARVSHLVVRRSWRAIRLQLIVVSHRHMLGDLGDVEVVSRVGLFVELEWHWRSSSRLDLARSLEALDNVNFLLVDAR